jgi:hypothetical protein
MRGLAETGVACRCGNTHATKTGLCLYCNAIALGEARRKYHFTPELLAELRAAYGGNKRTITAGLDRLERTTGWPRSAFKQEARRRGWISDDHRKAWNPAEVEQLREQLGVVTLSRIARHLGRTVESVIAKAEKLHLSRRVREGYSLQDLQTVFGEHPVKVKRWYERGLLGRGRPNGHGVRIAEREVARFIRAFPGEYSFRKVDQEWMKSMLFGELADWGTRV